MSMIPALLKLYRSAGYEPVTGYNSYHFANYMDAPFTRFIKDARLFGIGAGLALQEVMFLENFREFIDPRGILVIGNSFGWSTLALGLIFPKAKVVSIDPNQEGNALTNELAKSGKLNVIAAEGWSPRDLEKVVSNNLGGPVDFVLIDGLHEHDAVLADFDGCMKVIGDSAVLAFHDVLNWDLIDAFRRMLQVSGMSGKILTRTASGMALAWRTIPPELEEYILAFCDDINIYRAYRRHCLGDSQRIERGLARL